jgi:hypothetical protein
MPDEQLPPPELPLPELVTGFWVVLDTILKRLLGGEPPTQPGTHTASVGSTGENA